MPRGVARQSAGYLKKNKNDRAKNWDAKSFRAVHTVPSLLIEPSHFTSIIQKQTYSQILQAFVFCMSTKKDPKF